MSLAARNTSIRIPYPMQNSAPAPWVPWAAPHRTPAERDAHHCRTGLHSLVEAVRRHANHHYYDDPQQWDAVCRGSYDDIIEMIDPSATTPIAAILSVRRYLGV